MDRVSSVTVRILGVGRLSIMLADLAVKLYQVVSFICFAITQEEIKNYFNYKTMCHKISFSF